MWGRTGSIGLIKLVKGEFSRLQHPSPTFLSLVPAALSLFAHRNVIHGSDSVESAQQEISLWFRPEELPCWEDTAAHWIYE